MNMSTNAKKWLKVALGTGLFVLDQSERARKGAKERVGDQLEDARDFAQDSYRVAADRAGRIADAVRGADDHRSLWNVARFVFGVGVGIGVGILVAPANGEQTRAKIADKAQEFAGDVRQRFAAWEPRTSIAAD